MRLAAAALSHRCKTHHTSLLRPTREKHVKNKKKSPLIKETARRRITCKYLMHNAQSVDYTEIRLILALYRTRVSYYNKSTLKFGAFRKEIG